MSEILSYNETVEDHFRNPRNPAGGPCAQDACGRAGSIERGTWIEFQLTMDDDEVQSARFRAYGCPHTRALASWLTEHLPGRKLSENFILDRHLINEALDLPVEKLSSVLLAEDALRACVATEGECNGA
ncbi:MAG: iron-sulfur cluster assembly scaffold protein [Gammaproteobacteria bacterium]